MTLRSNPRPGRGPGPRGHGTTATRRLGACTAAAGLHGLLALTLLHGWATPVRPDALSSGAQAGQGEGATPPVARVKLEREPPEARPASPARSPPPPPPAARPDAAATPLDPEPASEPAAAALVASAPNGNAVAVVSYAAAGAVRDCDLAGAIQARLQSDPQASLAASGWPEAGGPFAAPRLLWDGRWVDAEALGGGDTLAPIRQVVAAVVAEAPSECLGRTLEGALAFSIPPAPPTVGGEALRRRRAVAVGFALGAARWRWIDLLPDAPPAELASAAPATSP